MCLEFRSVYLHAAFLALNFGMWALILQVLHQVFCLDIGALVGAFVLLVGAYLEMLVPFKPLKWQVTLIRTGQTKVNTLNEFKLPLRNLDHRI